MATIEDVARLAGVSVATVSRVLNDSSSVRPATAETVRKAINKLDYTPNLSARNLRRNESRVVLALAPNFSNPYYSHILTGIGDAAHAGGYSMLMCSTGGKSINEKSALELLESHRADGALLLGCDKNAGWIDAYAQKYPLVMCCEYVPSCAAPSVTIDNYSASRDTLEYILSLGHKKIAILSAGNDFISTDLREKAYFDVMSEQDSGRKLYPVFCSDADYSFTSAYAAAREMLSLSERPTAIFCVSDILALGAISAANDMGINVPGELTVTGFDDVDYTSMFHPYLTTVCQPCYEIGKKGFELLQSCINGNFPQDKRIYLPHKLVMRESAAEIK